MARAAGLNGSHASMVHQHETAMRLDYDFVRNSTQVTKLASAGLLERVAPSADVVLARVSYPFARPEVRSFVEHLGAAYRLAIGSPLVVTSLTRPTALQPTNASPLSVHPAGMAVDLRVPESARARQWLESTLLAMEDAGVVDVTREHRPSHFHVAVFPGAAAAILAKLDSATARASAEMDPVPAMAVASLTPVDSSGTPSPLHAALYGGLVAGMLLALFGAATRRAEATSGRLQGR